MSVFARLRGQLVYAPHTSFQLPVVQHCYNLNAKGFEAGPPRQVEFHDPEEATVLFRRPLFKLEWPGTLHLKNPEPWPTDLDFVPPGTTPEEHGFSLYGLVWAGHLPQEVPPVIGYHLAVNRHLYHSKDEIPCGRVARRAVGGLDVLKVERVLNGRFALSGAVQSALTYLKWLAETHYDHPFLSGSTGITNHRDISLLATTMFFQTLGDCLYDEGTHWWDRTEDKTDWWKMATQLFWECRTDVRDPMYEESLLGLYGHGVFGDDSPEDENPDPFVRMMRSR